MGLEGNMEFSGPIWVTGAGGLIGSYLVRELSQRGLPGRVLCHKELELTDCDRLIGTFLAEKPSAVIHCAALSSSVVCQEQPRLARKVNVFTTNNGCFCCLLHDFKNKDFIINSTLVEYLKNNR